MKEKTASYNTRLGHIAVGYTPNAVVSVGFINFSGVVGEPSSLSNLAYEQVEEYLAGQRQEFEIPLQPCGTAFQQVIWQILQQIPYGQTLSYGQVATLWGNKNAARAVGMACNKNPIAIIIPCHRVVGANGVLVGYAAGVGIKSKLLDIERANMAPLYR